MEADQIFANILTTKLSWCQLFIFFDCQHPFATFHVINFFGKLSDLTFFQKSVTNCKTKKTQLNLVPIVKRYLQNIYYLCCPKKSFQYTYITKCLTQYRARHLFYFRFNLHRCWFYLKSILFILSRTARLSGNECIYGIKRNWQLLAFIFSLN